jgi:4-hydroxy-3-polyprenylbenzoate decarboxylase
MSAMFETLRDFVAALEKAGELVRVKARVSPMLEIAEITDRVSKSPAASLSTHAKTFDPRHAHLGGKALLFENVEGSAMPVLINSLGSYRRMEMAMGCTEGGFESIADRIERMLKPEPPTGFMDKMKKGLELAKIASFAPKYVKHGLCQEVVRIGDAVNLLELPIIKCWPLDGDIAAFGHPPAANFGAQFDPRPVGQGRYITFGGIYTIHPDDADKPAGVPRPSRNIGMYRAQLIDRNHTAMHWHMHHDGARHWRAWKKHNEARGDHSKGMPLAVVFGGESVLPYAATAPLPPGISELFMAGFLNDAGISLVQCKTIDMQVPANAEIVIEGHVSTESGGIGFDPRRVPESRKGPESRVRSQESVTGDSGLRTPDSGLRTADSGSLGPGAAFEGPFGDHTGFYSLPDRYPVLTVTAITHRRDPIYPTTIVGYPPQEDYYMGKATERIFLPALRTMIHDIIDYHLPMFGAFHNCAFVKIRKEYPLQARRVMHAIWGAGQMSWTKFIIVVDDDVNVHDQDAVLFHLCANCDPGRDVELVNGPLDILDHAAPRLGAGHKMGFDATRKITGEECGGHPVRDWPTLLEMDDATRDKVSRRWREYGFQ